MKAKGAGGQGKVGARIVGPTHKAVPCRVESGPGAESSVVRWTPSHEGPYEVEVTYDGHPVPGSPFPVEAVPPTDPSKVGRWGGGELGGVWGRFGIVNGGGGVLEPILGGVKGWGDTVWGS